jgi:hypothetical protein
VIGDAGACSAERHQSRRLSEGLLKKLLSTQYQFVGGLFLIVAERFVLPRFFGVDPQILYAANADEGFSDQQNTDTIVRSDRRSAGVGC